jgi:uncharacterized protein (TIGR03435 family)
MPRSGSKRFLLAVGIAALAVPVSFALYGQTAAKEFQMPPTQQPSAPAERLEFDVASVRQSKSGATPYSNFPISSGTMYGPTHGIFSSTNRPLVDYIAFAYMLTDSQRQDLISQLPAWALSDGLDIEAKSENHDPTKDQMRLMMQSLLADRFKLTIHTETRRVSVFALVLVKPGVVGPQLKPHPAETSCSAANPAAPAADATTAPPTKLLGVWPTSCGGINRASSALSPGVIRAGARNVSMESFASSISGLGHLDRPVMDQTGLTGNFDFVLEFAPETAVGESSGNSQPDRDGPTFVEALKQQLGLKLDSEKAAADYIRVDRVERPSAN